VKLFLDDSHIVQFGDFSTKALIAHWSETHTPTSGTQDVGRWFGWSLLSLSGIDYILCQADSGDDSKSLMRRQVCLLEGIMSTLASVFLH